MPGSRRLLSIVVPVYQNAGTLEALYGRIRAALDPHGEETAYEVVFVDDGSTDDSWRILLSLRELDPARIALIRFVRNFGQLAAMLAGYRAAAGDCCASISADLQDPPELMWEMYRAWREGHKLVVAARDNRSDGLFYDVISKIAWKLLKRFAVRNIPVGGFDYFLMDREIAAQYVDGPEQHLFLQGRLLYYVREPFVIRYDRERRPVGRSQTNLMRRLKYLIDGFTAYSFIPLRLMSVTGLIFGFVAFAYGSVIIVQTVWWGAKVEGWASLAVLVLFLSGVQLLFLGVIGEYLWRGVEEIRRRPHYVVESVIDKDARRE